PRADRAASSRRAGRAFRATPAPHSTPRQFGASANDARRIRHHDLAAQLERMIDRLRRFRRCALGLAPPAERSLARRARDHPGTPGAGGIVTETREVKQLERIVSSRLTGLRPGYLDAVARPALDVRGTQPVVDRTDAEAVPDLEVDRVEAGGLGALGLEQLDRQQIAVLVRRQRGGQGPRDKCPELAVAVHPLASDAIAHVDEVRARGPEMLRAVAPR